MATTAYGTNDPIAVKVWSKKLAYEALKETQATKFMGTTSDDLIQVRDELNKGPGDKITYTLRMQLAGLGTIGDGTLEGNEESLTTYTDSLVINQLRHAVRSAGRMSQQRVPFSVREEALMGLKDWWADRIDFSFFNQICCNTAETNYVATGGTQNTGLNAPFSLAKTDPHYLSANTTTAGDENLGSTNIFTYSMIDRAKERAVGSLGLRTANAGFAPIRPLKVNGSRFYVAFIHPYQVTDLRTNTQTGQFLDIQKAAMTGGEIKDNPIFDGSLGEYNGTLIYADSRVTTGVNSTAPSTAVTSARRAVFAGAQAAMMAFGRENGPDRFTWVEELFDYENQLGVSAGAIWALKATTFNGSLFGSEVMASYAAQH